MFGHAAWFIAGAIGCLTPLCISPTSAQSAPAAGPGTTAPAATTSPATPLSPTTLPSPQAAAWLAAARSGDAVALKRMLVDDRANDERALLGAADADGRTALHLAIAGKHVPAMIALLKAGADPRRADRAGRTPMRQAAQCGSEDLATDFLLAVPDLDIFEAIRTNDVDAAGLILAGDCDVINRQNQTHGPKPIYYAVRAGRCEIVRLLLDAGARKEDYHDSLLAEAAEAGHADCVKLLLERGFDVNPESDMGGPLQRAANASRADLVELLLAAGAKVNVVSEHENSPLGSAAWHGNLALCRRLLEAGADVDFPADWGWRAIHTALWAGHPEAARLLLERGAKVDAFAAAGLGRLEELKTLMRRPLDRAFEKSIATHPAYFAARCGQAQTLAWLLDQGAAATLTDKHYKYSLLHHAARGGNPETIRLLLARGAKVDAPSAYEGTPLAFALLNNKTEAAPELLRAGASVDGAGDDYSPLTVGAEGGHLEACRFLLDRRADINGSGAQTSPLAQAAGYGKIDVVRFLLERGADLKRGQPLARAAESGQVEVLKLLLEKGADPNAAEVQRDSPLKQAVWRAARRDMAWLLVRAGAKVSPKEHDELAIYLGVLGDLELVKALLDRGLTLKFTGSHVNANGMSSIYEAAVRFGRKDLIRFLLSRGAPLSPPSPQQAELAPLNIAAQAGSRVSARVLLQAGAIAQAGQWSPYHPLLAAADRDHAGVFRLLAPRPQDLPLDQRREIIRRAAAANALRLLRHLIQAGAISESELAIEAVDGAMMNGHTAAVQLLLASGVSVNLKKGQASLLHLALRRDNVKLDMIETLLRGGAEVNATDERGLTPLHQAILINRYDLARRILAADAGLDAFTAAAMGRLDVLAEAVGRDPALLRKSVGLGQPLHWAAHGGDPKAVRFLLDQKADVNAQPPPREGPADGKLPTPLGYAAMNKRLEAARVLLQAGADPKARLHGHAPAPLHHAVMNRDDAMVRLLLDAGADIEADLYNGWRPIHLAASHALPEIVRLLSSRGADLTAGADTRRLRPLTLAADETNYQGYGPSEDQDQVRPRRPATIQALLDEHARRKIPPAPEALQAVLVWACRHAQFDLVRRSVELGAGLNFMADLGQTPLLVAVAAASQDGGDDKDRTRPVRLEIIRYLVERGADPSVAAGHENPLESAERVGDKEIVELLRTVKPAGTHPVTQP